MRERVETLTRNVVSGWRRFWFEPVPTSTIAVIRIAVGVTTFFWGLSLLPTLFDFFAPHGVFPKQPDYDEVGNRGIWGVFQFTDSKAALIVVVLLLIVAAACLTVGFMTRLAALVVFVAILSFERRNPFVFNSGDGLVRILTLYVLLAPAGAALSVDRWRRFKDRFWEFPARAPWALRLIQVQLSVIYISAVWDKVQGTTWNDGTAVSYAFQLQDHARFPLPGWLIHSLILSNILTFGTLVVELSMGTLVWVPAIRPFVMAAGISLHLGIDYRIRVAFFTFAILTPYLAFVRPERMSALVLAVRDRVVRRRAVRPAPAAAIPASGQE